ncbi:MAG: hypothetical protein J6I70_08000 [Bacteroidaceae bacterium]|nr:hypothetical protein [Bacteroidaceae bacterium]
MQAIDLGLSVKWADRNLGANSPTDMGGLYAWAEILSKNKYTWGNYKYWVCSGKFGPFLENHFSKEIHSIDSEDDAITYRYGKPWRIPTATEFQELINKCRWVKTSECGIHGFRIYGNNGNSIFLPTEGVEHYWSATRMKEPQHAKVLDIHYSKVQLFYRARYYGFNLRGVCDTYV